MNGSNSLIPPANGFTRRTRYVLSGLALVAFFSLIVIDFVLGLTAKDVPAWLYILLLCVAASGWGPVFDLLAALTATMTGGKR